MKSSVVSIDPAVMGGTRCFSGTRVPSRTLLDYVEAGDSIDEFLEDFPSVGNEKVIAFLEDSTALIIQIEIADDFDEEDPRIRALFDNV